MKALKLIGTILFLLLLLGCIRVEKAPQPEIKAPEQPMTKTPEPVKKTVVRTVPSEGGTTGATSAGTTATGSGQQTQSSQTTQGSSQTSGSGSQTTTSTTTSGSTTQSTTTSSTTTSKPKNIVATIFTSNVNYDGKDTLSADVKTFEKGKTVKFIFKSTADKVVQFTVSHSDPAKFKITEAVGAGSTTKRSAVFPEAGDYTLSVSGTGKNVAPITLKVA